MPATPVCLLPTPIASDGRGPGRSRQGGPNLTTAVDELSATPAGWGPYAPAIARWATALGRPVPAASELGTKGQPVLSPTFVEWLMGLPPGWVTDIGLPRTVTLRVLGNGVVPQQAAVALRLLLGALQSYKER